MFEVLTRTAKTFVFAIFSAIIVGCASTGPVPDDPYYAPVIPSLEARQPISNGSLFTDQTSIDLFGDRRARRVGDILTITLQENTVSSKSSDVGIKKDSDVTIPEVAGAAGTVLGNPLQLGGLSVGTSLSAEREFIGEADASQSNNLRGSIAVTVVEVLPNGNLIVRGEKWMTLNNGDEFIRFSGLVRPEDVAEDNTVVSTLVANARIAYSGKGNLADSQRIGWLGKFFNSRYWPF